jgi:hypothetical protein
MRIEYSRSREINKKQKKEGSIKGSKLMISKMLKPKQFMKNHSNSQKKMKSKNQKLDINPKILNFTKRVSNLLMAD